jgi:hypothetical protein
MYFNHMFTSYITGRHLPAKVGDIFWLVGVAGWDWFWWSDVCRSLWILYWSCLLIARSLSGSLRVVRTGLYSVTSEVPNKRWSKLKYEYREYDGQTCFSVRASRGRREAVVKSDYRAIVDPFFLKICWMVLLCKMFYDVMQFSFQLLQTGKYLIRTGTGTGCIVCFAIHAKTKHQNASKHPLFSLISLFWKKKTISSLMRSLGCQHVCDPPPPINI